MSYIEEINQKLMQMENSVTASQNDYNANVNAANSAFDLAKKDEYYPKLKKLYSDAIASVADFIKSMKSLILSLPNRYVIKEFSGTIDVYSAIAKIGFLKYSESLILRCNSEMIKITEQSTPEEDIKVIEKLSEYHYEVCEVCNQFDKFYYAYIRTPKMEQAATDAYNADLDRFKTDFDFALNNVYNTTLSTIAKYKTSYQQVTDKFFEERFAAQIGKQQALFPTKICLGAILHPVVNYRRDIVSKALSCGNVSNLAVVFEMPLVGSFDDYESGSSNIAPTTSQRKSLIDDFNFDF